MYCPTCRKKSLKELEVEETGVKVDVCKACRGIWFDAAELEGTVPVAAKRLGVPSGAPRTNRVCPRCRELLSTFPYPQTEITVDMCKRCRGLWLDKGELIQVRQVRSQLKKKGKLKEYALGGVKGTLRRFVDTALSVFNLREDSGAM